MNAHNSNNDQTLELSLHTFEEDIEPNNLRNKLLNNNKAIYKTNFSTKEKNLLLKSTNAFKSLKNNKFANSANQ